mmetsp:Transcript_75271/g.178847  ORF Transcript_75271/g.178847 Transcript_75271/m.178847 type:complete len:216 (+) Transcript_75271:181-828(+)
MGFRRHFMMPPLLMIVWRRPKHRADRLTSHDVCPVGFCLSGCNTSSEWRTHKNTKPTTCSVRILQTDKCATLSFGEQHAIAGALKEKVGTVAADDLAFDRHCHLLPFRTLSCASMHNQIDDAVFECPTLCCCIPLLVSILGKSHSAFCPLFCPCSFPACNVELRQLPAEVLHLYSNLHTFRCHTLHGNNMPAIPRLFSVQAVCCCQDTRAGFTLT